MRYQSGTLFRAGILEHLQGRQHPIKERMKHVVTAIVLVVLIGILLERLPQQPANQLAFPFRLLQMQMKEPDAELLMPVQGVPVKRVANTWNAPRPGGRQHHGQDIFARRGTPVVSATDGIVVRVGTNSLAGRLSA